MTMVATTATMPAMAIIPWAILFVLVLVVVGVVATVPIFFTVSMPISVVVSVRMRRSDAVLVTMSILAPMRSIVTTMMTCSDQNHQYLGQGHACSS